MANRCWKAFERAVAELFGGRRFWSNSGEAIDVESSTVVAQCKLVKRLSLEELTCLAETAERQALPRFKAEQGAYAGWPPSWALSRPPQLDRDARSRFDRCDIGFHRDDACGCRRIPLRHATINRDVHKQRF